MKLNNKRIAILLLIMSMAGVQTGCEQSLDISTPAISESVSETVSETKLTNEAVNNLEAVSEIKSETVSDTKSETNTTNEAVNYSEAVSETKSEMIPNTKSETKSEAEAKTKSETVSETITESGFKTENDHESITVSYLGPEGTYTQEACGVFFSKKGTYTPYKTVSDAVEALIKGESEYAVIPQENTIGGAVIDYVDIVIAKEELSVAGEVELPINQNLLTLPGTELKDIKKVYSHKQGIAQGKDWLKDNLPDAEIIEVSSTAEGARLVAEEGVHSNAAIASAACAGVYGLEVLQESIQNNDSNKTRFYVLSKDTPLSDKSDRMAFIASGKAEDLPGLMRDLEKSGMKLVTIHDRPRKTELGEYNYIIECRDSGYGNYEKLTANNQFQFRFLGEFPLK